MDRALATARRLVRERAYVEALQLYRAILEAYPHNVRAKEGLRALWQPHTRQMGQSAVVFRNRLKAIAGLHAAGRDDDALSEANALVADFPDEVQAHYILGSVLLSLRVPADAARCFTRAIALQPTFPEAYNNLGHALRVTGHRDEAIKRYCEAVKINPEFVAGWNNLGAALREAANAHAALKAVDKALVLAPNDFHTHMNRGHVLRDLGRYGEAIAELEAAVDLEPRNPAGLISLGNALRACGRHERAIEAYRRTIAIDPTFAGGHASLGMVLGEVGEADGAQAAFREALRLDPTAEAHRNLGTTLTYRAGDPELKAMRALSQSLMLDDDERMHLDFALAKAHDDIGDVNAAFAHLARANAIHRTNRPFDARAMTDLAGRLRHFYADGPKCLAEIGAGGPVPIFIVGMPRSGTTLVEQILASHSAVGSAGETNAFERAIHPFVHDLRACDASTIDPATLEGIRTAYRDGIAEYGLTTPYVVDKMLANFRFAGLVAMAMPDAIVIDVRRDPIATAWSIYKHYFASIGNDFAYAFDDIVQYYQFYVDLMAHQTALFPGRIVRFEYEGLLADQEGATRKLLAACGLPFEARCIAFHNTQRAVMTASAAAVRQPLYTGRSAAWRRYAHHLDPLADKLRAAGLMS